MATANNKAAPLSPKDRQKRRHYYKTKTKTWKHASSRYRSERLFVFASEKLSSNMSNKLNRISVYSLLVLTGISLFTGCHYRSPTTKVTTTGASVAIGTPPQIGLKSTRAQIDAFVAYFAAKGFPCTDLSAQYYPSGRVKTFHYRASYGNSKVEAFIDAARHTSSISTVEGLNQGLTTSSSQSAIRVY